jgi:hypothetical protein
MKPPRIYTLLGCTIEVQPGQQHAKASRPGGEVREFTSIAGGASAEVQAQRWVHEASAATTYKAEFPTKPLKLVEAPAKSGPLPNLKPKFEPPKDK